MDGYEPLEVSVDDVTKGVRIGEGSFAVVFAGTAAGVGDVVLKAAQARRPRKDWFSYARARRAGACGSASALLVGVAGSDLYLVWRDR